jgi:hypothetical protein
MCSGLLPKRQCVLACFLKRVGGKLVGAHAGGGKGAAIGAAWRVVLRVLICTDHVPLDEALILILRQGQLQMSKQTNEIQRMNLDEENNACHEKQDS